MLSVLFVDDDAASGGNGLGWGSAYNDLQDALSQAAALKADGDPANDIAQIWIAEGVYKPSAELEPGDPRSASFSLVDGVTLYGGFAGTETAAEGRDVAEHVTTLSGDLGVAGDPSDNAYTVVCCDDDIDASFDGLTISDGNADRTDSLSNFRGNSGGGIFNTGTLRIANSVLSGNSASGRRGDGGAIYSTGTLTITNSTLSGNSVNSSGGTGGAICSTGVLTIGDSMITLNSANGPWGDGGGIWSNGTSTISDSTISENSTTGNWGNGGGICSTRSLTITNSTLSENHARRDGGGVCNYGTLVVANSVFSGNVAQYGAGICSGDEIYRTTENAGTGLVLNVMNSTFSGNRARAGEGGGICKKEGSATVANSVFSGNSARSGAGIFNGRGLLTVANCTLVQNSGNAIGGYLGPLTLENSILWRNSGGNLGGYNRYEGLSAARNLIGIDPEFIRDPSDGGDGWGDISSTVDIDESANDDYGDLHLTPQSPAIDYGDDALAVDADGNLFATDVDGNPRYYDGSPVDVGAYEFQGVIAAGREGASLEVNISEDVFDPYDGRISLREAIYYAGIDVQDTAVTFEEALNGATLTLSGTPLWIDKTLTVDASSFPSLTIDGGGQSGVFAVIARTEDPVELNHLTITGGSADYGGGVFNSGSLLIKSATLFGNSAGDGGAIFNRGTLTMTNSVLSGNVSNGSSGGIRNDEGTLTVTNCTLAGNGGGIYNDEGTVTLHNSILWQNGNTDIGLWGTVAASRNLKKMDPSFVRDPSDGGDGWGDNPETPDVDESANDDFGDLRLTSESPAIDHGNDAIAVDANGNPLAIDLVGNPRNYGGLAVDIGAYEFQGEIPGGREEPSAEVNTAEDVFDLYDGWVSLREAIYYAGVDSPETTITFDPVLNGATIALSGTSLWIDKPLAVDASSLASLTIDAGGESRAFTIVARREDAVELNGLTITGGSEQYGAAIFNSGTLTVIDSVILGNRASKGAVYSSDGALTVAHCALSGNSTTYGGGIFASRGSLTVSGSTLSGNSAYYGGAIWSHECLLTVTTSTISGNSAVTDGGGICHYGSGLVITLNNTIVAGNTANVFGPDIYSDDHNYGGIFTGSHNLIGDGSGQTFENGTDGNIVGTTESPIDPLFVRAPSHGGDGWGDDPDTPDIDESANDDYGDLRLTADSPAVDAGDDALLPADTYDLDADGDTAEPVPFDLGGNIRIVGEAVDIGAYECVVLSGIPGDLNNDGVVGSADQDIVRTYWGRSVVAGSLLMGDASGDGRVGSADLDIVRANWGRTVPVAAATSVQDDAEITEDDSVYGPRNATDSAMPPWRRAERAWAEAIESLARGRRTSVSGPIHAAAIDLALLEWKR